MMVSPNLRLVLRILLVMFMLSTLSTTASAAWWDGNWPFKQPINVSVGSGTTAGDFAVEVILNSTNVGPGFVWANECSLDDTGRFRFVNASEDVELDYFIENCSVSDQNMSVWVEIDQPLSTSNYTTYLYYGNPTGIYTSDANGTFDFYLNFSSVTLLDEPTQNPDDLYEISDSGRSYRTIENTWKVATDFGTLNIQNTGARILELNMFSTDCGEISALKFDTNTGQENNRNYKFCGSQSWATTPDNTYDTLNVWERVFAVLNDFTESSATHLHLIGDDDASGGSTNTTFRDVRIRKYHTPAPTTSIGEEITANVTALLISPVNDTTTRNLTVQFTCNGITPSGSALTNISLYSNFTGTWQINETQIVSGTSNSSTFTKVLPDTSATYSWNCGVANNAGDDDFGDDNRTIIIDRDGPVLSINSPIGVLDDVTPRINITSDETMSSLRYNINNGSNATLCTNCNLSSDQFLHLAEGNYTIYAYANDTVGNNATVQSSFTLEHNYSYYDDFTDNSSVGVYDGAEWQEGNISYGGGTSFYEGIEIGYNDGNLNFIANQWNGASNAGEVDITCPGGDSACWFTNQNGTNITSLDIQNGVVTLDSDSTTVGFVMYSEEDVHTRLSPAPHPDEGDNFVAVCFISGQWYYDDNNGCNEPFTPVASDVLLANLTWGITSVSSITGASTLGTASVVSKEINVTENITRILNITWTEVNTDSQNNITIDVSVDNGITWQNVTNGLAVKNISANNSLVYRINLTSNGSVDVAIDDLNITWTDIEITDPNVTLLLPINDSDIVVGNPVSFLFNASDNDLILNCSLYINSNYNGSTTCGSGQNSSINFTSIGRGDYNWTVQVTDLDGISYNATNNTFSIVRDIRPQVTKSIESYGSPNQYLVTLNVTNRATLDYNGTVFDFVDTPEFVAGSFNTLFDDTFSVNGTEFNGTIYSWNFTLMPSESMIINYSIVGTSDYSLIKNWEVGLE